MADLEATMHVVIDDLAPVTEALGKVSNEIFALRLMVDDLQRVVERQANEIYAASERLRALESLPGVPEYIKAQQRATMGMGNGF